MYLVVLIPGLDISHTSIQLMVCRNQSSDILQHSQNRKFQCFTEFAILLVSVGVEHPLGLVVTLSWCAY